MPVPALAEIISNAALRLSRGRVGDHRDSVRSNKAVAAIANTIEQSEAVVITDYRLPVDDAGTRADADQALDDQRETIGLNSPAMT
jgi:hypothetical protein